MKKLLFVGIGIIVITSLFWGTTCFGPRPTPQPTLTPTPPPTATPTPPPTLTPTPPPTPTPTPVPEWKVRLPEPKLPPNSLKAYPSDDGYVVENSENNFGTAQLLLAGQVVQVNDPGNSTKTTYVAFLKFDLTQVLSQIPEGAEIVKANLVICVTGISSPGNEAVRVAFAEGLWEEGALTWSNAPKEGDLIWSGQLSDFRLPIFDFTTRLREALKNNLRTISISIGVWPEGDKTFLVNIASKESQAYPNLTFLEIVYRLPPQLPAPDEIVVRDPGFSLTEEGLIAIDLARIQGGTPLEKARSLAKELNEKGFLLFSVDSVQYNEESNSVMFVVEYFFAIYFDPISGSWIYLSDPRQGVPITEIVNRSIFVYAARILNPSEIVLEERIFDTYIYGWRSLPGKIEEIKEGKVTVQKMDGDKIIVEGQIKEVTVGFGITPLLYTDYPMPENIGLVGVDFGPDGLLELDRGKIQGSGTLERALSLATLFNEVGSPNFHITGVTYNETEKMVIFSLKFYFSVLLDRNTGSLIYNFDPWTREEALGFIRPIINSLMIYSLELLGPNQVAITTIYPDGNIVGYQPQSLTDIIDSLRQSTSQSWGNYIWMSLVATFDAEKTKTGLPPPETPEQK